MTVSHQVDGDSAQNGDPGTTLCTGEVPDIPPQATAIGAGVGAAHATVQALLARLRVVWCHLAARLQSRRLRRALALLLGVALLVAAMLGYPAMWLVCHVFFDRTGVPDLESFIRFELPTTGVIRDVHGQVMIELAHEYRQVVTFDEVPLILRQAILAAEDKRFFSHSGVDYYVLPRVAQKAVSCSVAEWRQGNGLRLLMPQGGSTLTQQLVRGYFLQDLMGRSNQDKLFNAGMSPPRLLAVALGPSAANKLLRKMEEVRLALWLEQEMRSRYGSQSQAKREIFERYASFIYLGNGRYGFAAASEYYFGKPLSSFTQDDAGTAALLAAISKAPRDYAPVPGKQRVIERRNRILALMARNGYIPENLAKRCQGEPIRVAAPPSTIKTDAPAVIGHVFDELGQLGGSRFGIEDLLQGRIDVRATVDARVQTIVNEALEHGLDRYEKRHPRGKGLIQGSVVVLANADAAILAETGGRRFYADRDTRYSDYNRVRGSLRQPGSAMKPLVYLAAFETGLDLATTVPDEPIEVPLGGVDEEGVDEVKLITNYDNLYKGPIPMRQALAESRNTVAVWITREIGVRTVIKTAHRMGIHTPLRPYISTGLGASEVCLLELADAYRAIASGVVAEPHIIHQVRDGSGASLYEALQSGQEIRSAALHSIQEGLRSVVRLPNGTAHSLAARSFPVPVMGKTGTTNGFRDALFVGSTYGRQGITVAVRIGYDDNRPLGNRETGGRTALPVFREIMLRVYKDQLVGQAPRFPREIEGGIDQYLAAQATAEPGTAAQPGPGTEQQAGDAQALVAQVAAGRGPARPPEQ